MKKIHSVGRMIVLNTYWLGLSFKWNALHPIILPAVMLNYVPETLKNTYLGLLDICRPCIGGCFSACGWGDKRWMAFALGTTASSDGCVRIA